MIQVGVDKSASQAIAHFFSAKTCAKGESLRDKNLTIISTDDVNDDKAYSYYNLTSQEIEVLRNNQLASIRLEKYSNSIHCPVDNNLRTYFNPDYAVKEKVLI